MTPAYVGTSALLSTLRRRFVCWLFGHRWGHATATPWAPDCERCGWRWNGLHP